jgi:hypothetical protein
MVQSASSLHIWKPGLLQLWSNELMFFVKLMKISQVDCFEVKQLCFPLKSYLGYHCGRLIAEMFLIIHSSQLQYDFSVPPIKKWSLSPLPP